MADDFIQSNSVSILLRFMARLNFATRCGSYYARMTELVTIRWQKNFDDRQCRLDRIPDRDEQTDRQTHGDSLYRPTHSIVRMKIYG